MIILYRTSNDKIRFDLKSKFITGLQRGIDQYRLLSGKRPRLRLHVADDSKQKAHSQLLSFALDKFADLLIKFIESIYS